MKMLALAALLSLARPGEAVHFELKHGTAAERKTQEELEKILRRYDLRRYTFTHEVVIDENAIPHSTPVITLHTRHLGADDELLSAYLHEQLHWYLDAHQKETDLAEKDLRKLYPKVPVGYPEGAKDEESTYLHLIDCYLEIQADRHLMGSQRAARVISSMDHYKWVYKTILQDEPSIANIVDSRGLAID